MPVVKFYDYSGKEVFDEPEPKEGLMPLVNYFRWAMQRAIDCTDDRTKAASFASDMRKHPGIPQIQKELCFCMMGMKGKELDDFIKGFSVPGVKRIEFV